MKICCSPSGNTFLSAGNLQLSPSSRLASAAVTLLVHSYPTSRTPHIQELITERIQKSGLLSPTWDNWRMILAPEHLVRSLWPLKQSTPPSAQPVSFLFFLQEPTSWMLLNKHPTCSTQRGFFPGSPAGTARAFISVSIHPQRCTSSDVTWLPLWMRKQRQRERNHSP